MFRIDEEPMLSGQNFFKILRTALPYVVVAGITFTIVYGFYSSSRRLSDFAGYYTASDIVAHRDSISHMYDDSAFADHIKRLGLADTTMAMYVNPPPVSVVMLPFIWMDPFRAKIAWNVISLFLICLCWYLSRNLFELESKRHLSLILAGVLASTVPFLRNLQRGQLYILMLLLVILLWKGLKEQRHWLTGVSVSLLLMLKYFGWLFVVFLLLRRRWKDLFATVLCFTIGTAATMALVGPETYVSHIQRLLASFASMDASITGLPSVQAFFGGLFVYHPQWNPAPVANLPLLANLLTIATLALAAGITFSKRNLSAPDGSMREFLGVLVLSVVFTPLAAEHHYILMSLPMFFVITKYDVENIAPSAYLWLVVVGYATFGWSPSIPPPEIAGAMKVFAFTRLYGGLLLWMIISGDALNVTKDTVPFFSRETNR